MNIEKLRALLIEKFKKSPEEALNWLEILISDKAEVFDEIIQLKARFRKNEEQSRLGNISHDNYDTNRNGITTSILKIVRSITVDDFFRDKESAILKGIVDDFRNTSLTKVKEFESLRNRLITLEETVKKLNTELEGLKSSSGISEKQEERGNMVNKMPFPKDWNAFLYNLSNDSPDIISNFLQELEINNNSDIVSLSPLINFQELKKISFVNVRFGDFSVLTNLAKLSQITFEDCNSLFDLSFIGELRQLKDLKISYYPYAPKRTINIADLALSDSIQYLSLYYADVLNFDKILEIKSLKVVELDEETFNLHSEVISKADMKFINLGSSM
ncbi:MAG: hypothetical protein Sapg2KO_37750 [Saprospiraceae bacterium]